MVCHSLNRPGSGLRRQRIRLAGVEGIETLAAFAQYPLLGKSLLGRQIIDIGP